MRAQSVALIYSRSLGTLRRIFVPDDDREIDHPWHLPQEGEDRVLVSRAEYEKVGLAGAQQLLNEALGRVPEPHADRFAVIDADGNVIGAIIADPACGAPIPEGCTLVHHPDATQGWTYRSGSWIAPPDE